MIEAHGTSWDQRQGPRSRFFFPKLPESWDCRSDEDGLGVVWPECRDAEKNTACAKMADAIVRQLSGGQDEPSRAWARHQVVAWTSTGDGDGKTDLLLLLAPRLAERIAGGVLAVDADPSQSDLTKRLDVPRGSNVSRPALIYPTNVDRLSVLPALRGVRSRTFDPSWIDELREAWPLTILDMNSLAAEEAATLANCCDAVYLVVRLGFTPRRDLSKAVRAVRRGGGRLLGCLAIV
jgi:Mrp family chromosome partitioning ATPase